MTPLLKPLEAAGTLNVSPWTLSLDPLDEPLTLKQACEEIFKGRITPSTLKAEHGRGNLEMAKVGKAYFTSKRHVMEMIEKCRVKAQGRVSGSIGPEAPGPSSTEKTTSARASLRNKLSKLKKR
jgi:hypothetical protein